MREVEGRWFVLASNVQPGKAARVTFLQYMESVYSPGRDIASLTRRRRHDSTLIDLAITSGWY